MNKEVNGKYTLGELTGQDNGRPVVVPFGSQPAAIEETPPAEGRPVVSFGGEVRGMLLENKDKAPGDPLGINSEEFKEKVNKSIDESVEIFTGTAAIHKDLLEKSFIKEKEEKEKQEAARKSIVGEEGNGTGRPGFHPSAVKTPTASENTGVDIVDSLEEKNPIPTVVVEPKSEVPTAVITEGPIDEEEGPWVKVNVYTKAHKKANQSILKRKRGSSVEIYLPASNLVMRFYAINTVLRATQLSRRIIEYGLYFDDYRVLESIYEHSEILAADGDKIEFAQWLEIIHNDDINLVYLGSLMATTGDRTLEAVLICGECGQPVKTSMNYMKLYTDNLTDDIKAAARLYDPAKTIKELQSGINMGEVRSYSWTDSDDYTYVINMTAASKHKDLVVSELAKEWLVNINYDALTSEIANDRTKTVAEKLGWLHNAKPQLIHDYLPLISMSILIDEIRVYHKSNPTRHEVVKTVDKYGEIMEAVNDLDKDVLNKIDEEMFKFIPKNKMTLISRQYNCGACKNDAVSVIDRMNHMYFLEMMRVIHG